MLNQINEFFGIFVNFLYPIIFFDISFGFLGTALPLIVLVLLSGAIIFTIYFKFINVRGFRHAIDIVKGKYFDCLFITVSIFIIIINRHFLIV